MSKRLEPTPADEMLDAIAEAKQEARAQGRAEILREVAKLPSPVTFTTPMFNTTPSQFACSWCGASWAIASSQHPDNGCLFVRAQQAASEER